VTVANAQSSAVPAVEGRSWIGPVFACLFILSMMKGIRMPNRWAMTHYLFTYHEGFMKRALWGELLRRIFGSWTASYFFLAGVGLAVFAALAMILWRACRRVPLSTDTVRFLVVFAASPALAFLAHLAGYLEQVGYLALMAALLFRRYWRLQLVWLLGAAALLPLVHEASIFWVACLTGLAAISGTAKPSQRFLALALVAVMWAASTAAVLRFGRVSRLQLEALRADRASFAQFLLRPDAFDTLRTTLAESRVSMEVWWPNPDRQVEFAYSLLVFAPAAFVLGAIAVRRARLLDGGLAMRATAIALALGAAAGPLVLHAVALDQHRWNALAAFNVGLAALILLQALPEAAPPRRSGGLAVALVVAVWSIASHGMFFDDYQPTHPPFSSQIDFLVRAIRTPDRAMWIPRD
jgi:hypothetical protein